MTQDRSDRATATRELDGHIEMEIAGPPVVTSARGRRRVVALLAVAFVSVVLLQTSTGWPSGDPSASTQAPSAPQHSASPPSPAEVLDGLPQGLAPAVPYLRGGMLHVGGDTIRTTANRLLAADGTVLVGRSDDDVSRWWIVDGLDLVAMHQLDDASMPALSPHGDLVAWTSYPDPRTTRITAMRTLDRTEVDHVDLDAPFATCCGGGQEVDIIGFDLGEQLYWSQGASIRVWQPGTGTPPHRLSGGGTTLQIAPAGPVRQCGALGTVDARGHWSEVRDLPADQGMVWSTDGALLAYAGDATGTVTDDQPPTDRWILDLATGTRTQLDLPDAISVQLVGFESDQAVLVDAFARPHRHYLLRCAVSDGACERTLRPGRPTWTFSAHSWF
jgi:hypothetical protein